MKIFKNFYPQCLSPVFCVHMHATLRVCVTYATEHTQQADRSSICKDKFKPLHFYHCPKWFRSPPNSGGTFCFIKQNHFSCLKTSSTIFVNLRMACIIKKPCSIYRHYIALWLGCNSWFSNSEDNAPQRSGIQEGLEQSKVVATREKQYEIWTLS